MRILGRRKGITTKKNPPDKPEPQAPPAETVACPRGAILDSWSTYDWDDGVQIDKMEALERLLVQTRNSTYEIIVISPRTGEVMLRGGLFFPEFTRVRLSGSTLGGSFLKRLGIYPGFKMEIQEGMRRIVTTSVRSIDQTPHEPGQAN